MATTNSQLAAAAASPPKDFNRYYRTSQFLNDKGCRYFDRMPLTGLWDAIWHKDADWFNLKQEPGRKRVCRGWEKHADDVNWEPGPHTPMNPDWYNSILSGPWTGRKDWWSELDWENPFSARGRDPMYSGFVREWDPSWWDPPVKKGTAFEGVDGTDGSFTPSIMYKLDRPLPISEWSRHVADTSTQGRQIAGLATLSPQHPGLRINSGNDRDGAFGQPAEQVGLAAGDFINSDAHVYPSLWRSYPRFWDAPLGENNVEKTLFGAKVGLYYGVARSGWAVLTEPTKYYKVPYGQDFTGFSLSYRRAWGPALVKFLPTYVTFPAVFTGLWSLASKARGGKDDNANALLPCAVCGAMWGTAYKNTFRGFAFAGLSYTAMVVFQAARGMQYSYGGPNQPMKWSLDPAPLTGAVDAYWTEAKLLHKPSLQGGQGQGYTI